MKVRVDFHGKYPRVKIKYLMKVLGVSYVLNLLNVLKFDPKKPLELEIAMLILKSKGYDLTYNKNNKKDKFIILKKHLKQKRKLNSIKL